MKLTKILLVLVSLIFWSEVLNAGTIHGFVREKNSREPIIMGNVWIKDTTIGTTTNEKGYYVLPSLPPGTYTIYFRYIGYKTETFEKQIGQSEDIELNVYLESEALQMEEVMVTAEKTNRELDIKPSQIIAEVPKLRTIPQVAEADLFRAIQMLPGVATLSDFSAGLYIRGGSPDQNLILLDGIDVYNPNHMFGFFSTFNTDAIKSVELLKGGFPAHYGGRLSSVLNVYNKEGNREEFEGVARLSLLSATTTLEGPWKKGSWMISGRRTYLDIASKMVDMELPYYFYDGHVKLNYDIDKNNQTSISFYVGNDKLDLSQEGTSINLDWGNKTFSTQWTHLFNSKLYSHFNFAGSRFDSDTKVEFDEVEFGIENKITDLALKGKLTYTPTSRHSMDFGFETKMLDFSLKYRVVDTDYLNTFAGNYYSLFAQDNYKITPFTIIQAGLRLDHYSDGSYTRFDPRFSVKHLLNDNMNVTLSYGKYHQFLNQVLQEGFSFADMWFPVDETFKPGQADHYIIGFNFDNRKTFSVNIEAFYKDYRNLAEYRTFRAGDETLENQTAAQNFHRGNGFAYGGDIYFRNNIWRLEGWLGYSLGWTKKKIEEYNFGEVYYPTYDRRHTITAIQDFRLGKKWRLNFAFKYATGQPYTEVTARYAVQDPAGRVYYQTLDGKKNFYRLPDYHRLDVGLFHNTRYFGIPTEVFVQVVNVYNRENVWFREWDVYEANAEVDDQTMLPLLPTFGFSIHF